MPGGRVAKAALTSRADAGAQARAVHGDIPVISVDREEMQRLADRLLGEIGRPDGKAASPAPSQADPERERSAMTTEQRLPPAELSADEHRELVEQTDQELQAIEAEIARLLIRKNLIQTLRHYLFRSQGGAET